MNCDTDIQSFYESIKIALAGELPGNLSHRKMMPANRSNKIMPKNDKTVKQAAVLIQIFVNANNALSTLFIRRPQYEGVHAGQIAFPGGKAEPTDKNLIVTALREAKEEVAAQVSTLKIAGTLSPIYIPPSNFTVLPVVAFHTQKSPVFIADATEVEELLTIELQNIFADSAVHNGTVKSVKYTLQAPYFAVNSLQIWGATAMIVSELKDVILSIKHS